MNRTIIHIFVVYVFVFIFILSCGPLDDGDFWFHLKTGEFIVQNHVIPHTELFSFTNYGRPWVAHGWLSGLVFYLLYLVGGFNLLIAVFGLLVAITFWITFRRLDAHPIIAGCAVFLGVLSILTNVGVRPRVFTLLFTNIYLAILYRYAYRVDDKKIWWLVPIMVLWANLHGGYLIGLVLIGLTIIGEILDTAISGEPVGPSWPKVRTLIFVLTACFVAVLLNPYGIRLYTFPLKVISSKVFQQVVVDWMSPDFHQSHLTAFVVLLFLVIIALVFSPKRVRPSELLIFLATLYASLSAQRNIIIFVLVAVPLLANYGHSWLISTSQGNNFLRPPKDSNSRGSTLVTLLALLPLVFFLIKLKTTVFVPSPEQIKDVPMQAVEYLKERQLTGNTFTEVNIWGGYLIWALPSNPVFIDGRDVYPESFVKEYVQIIQGIPFQEPFQRYHVKIAIVEPESVLNHELRESPEWQQIYQDGIATVFIAKPDQ